MKTSTWQMAYSYDSFLYDVYREVLVLKKNATEAEIAALNKEQFDSFSQRDCLYGLMTGNCYSKRAAQLIWLCCKMYICVDYRKNRPIKPNDSFQRIFEMQYGEVPFYGATKESFLRSRMSFDRFATSIINFSALEFYLFLKESKSANVIDFLKGTMEQLIL